MKANNAGLLTMLVIFGVALWFHRPEIIGWVIGGIIIGTLIMVKE
jgi:uncharacterized transporter YbjL